MQQLKGKVAWVTGAGSGIGEAAAVMLAEDGATVVLTGRRREPLEAVAKRIHGAGGVAHAQEGDLGKASTTERIAAFIREKLGRLDVLVNNAGINIADRQWSKLKPAMIEDVVAANLNGAFYCAMASLPMMRAQGDGVLIHTASVAGRWPSIVSGAVYSATKHGVVAMSHTINMEECINGIRSCVICPGEVATPILDKRPVPVSAEERAKMLQPEDCGDLIRYVAALPKHVCLNEIVITPTWNRGYVRAFRG
ncbi:MAG TPA: SDR family oxidoreductase [Stellaceae bacterium]|nr:SDR family oxidoreductase [Stellaceae bacterium]